MPSPLIFISYSHKDMRWLNYVKSHLAPATAHGLIRLWDDRRIKGGTDWQAEIEEALEGCAVCVLLVSRHSLSSPFIRDVEMRRMLERHYERRAHLYPIVVTSTIPDRVSWLRKLNLRPEDGTALELYEPGPRNRVMALLAREILDIVEEIETQMPPDHRRDFQIRDDSQDNPVRNCVELRRGTTVNESNYHHFHLMPELRCGTETVLVDNVYVEFGVRQLELRLKLRGCEIAPGIRLGDRNHPFIRAEGGDTWIIKGPREQIWGFWPNTLSLVIAFLSNPFDFLLQFIIGQRDSNDVLSRLVLGEDELCGINALEDGRYNIITEAGCQQFHIAYNFKSKDGIRLNVNIKRVLEVFINNHCLGSDHGFVRLCRTDFDVVEV